MFNRFFSFQFQRSIPVPLALQNIKVVNVYRRSSGVILSEFSFLQFQRSIHNGTTKCKSGQCILDKYWCDFVRVFFLQYQRSIHSPMT